MKVPDGIAHVIEHNGHALVYQSLADFLRDFDDSQMPTQERARSLASGEVWTVTTWPDTPVGSRIVAASTLETALEWAARDAEETRR